jgi:hypothetical protein
MRMRRMMMGRRMGMMRIRVGTRMGMRMRKRQS